MGKSRAIDELSKKHLVLPLVLREDLKGKFLNDCSSPNVDWHPGFPPPDKEVRNWLLQGQSKMEAFTQSGAFLCTLFVTLLRYLQQIDTQIPPPSGGGGPKSLEGKF